MTALLLGSLVLLTTGCQSSKPYSVAEHMVNHFLNSETDDYVSQIAPNDHNAVTLSFDALSVDIGRDEGKSVIASGLAKAVVTQAGRDNNFSIKLQLSGQPHFDTQRGSIRLDQVHIHAYELAAASTSNDSRYILANLDNAVQRYFAQHPIYILDKSSPAETKALKSSTKVNVNKGQLVFS